MLTKDLKVAGKTKKATSEKKTLEIKVIPSLEPRLGRVYSNYVQVSFSQYDFTIRFGDAPPGGDVDRIKQRDTITIPNIIDIVVVPDLIPKIINAMDIAYNNYLEIFKDPAKEDEETE